MPVIPEFCLIILVFLTTDDLTAGMNWWFWLSSVYLEVAGIVVTFLSNSVLDGLKLLPNTGPRALLCVKTEPEEGSWFMMAEVSADPFA